MGASQRACLSLGLVALVTIQAAPAQAQALSGCAKILWDFVGKPLAGVMVEKGGGMLFDYFADKLKSQPQAVITERDIQNLTQEFERNGSNECELRRQMEAMYAGPPDEYRPQTFSAETYCPITGAVGHASNMPTLEEAMIMAIEDCEDQGGVPACCQQHVHPVR